MERRINLAVGQFLIVRTLVEQDRPTDAVMASNDKSLTRIRHLHKIPDTPNCSGSFRRAARHCGMSVITIIDGVSITINEG